LGGPVFKRIAEQVLAYLDVAHDVPMNSDLEFAGNKKQPLTAGETSAQISGRARDRVTEQEQATFKNVAAKSAPTRTASEQVQGPTIAFSEEDSVTIPDLTGQTVRSVTESCSRLGLTPLLIGSGVAVEQSPGPGSLVQRGSTMTVRFGRAAATVSPVPPMVAPRNVH
jgi:stage V sporulation protein D (sporulation-specific penicillin-binding protein)